MEKPGLDVSGSHLSSHPLPLLKFAVIVPDPLPVIVIRATDDPAGLIDGLNGAAVFADFDQE